MFSRSLLFAVEEDLAGYVSELYKNFMMHHFYLCLITHFFLQTKSQINNQAFSSIPPNSTAGPLLDNLIHLSAPLCIFTCKILIDISLNFFQELHKEAMKYWYFKSYHYLCKNWKKNSSFNCVIHPYIGSIN